MADGELGATGQKIYDFIRDTHAATGLVPSVREIRAAIGVSSIGTVGYWLDRLEALNLIRRDSGKNRSIQLRGPSPTVSVPLVGDVRAGRPSDNIIALDLAASPAHHRAAPRRRFVRMPPLQRARYIL